MVVAVPNFKLAYAAVPKAACTSIKAVLAQHDPAISLPPEDERSGPTYHAVYPTQRWRKWQWKPYQGEDWFRFCVIRDPSKRLMSAYVNRVVEKKELHNSRNLQKGRVNLPMDPDPDFFFQNLEAYNQAASVIKHHTFTIQMFTGPSLGRFTDVYKVERDMPRLAEDLSARLGAQVTIPRENKTRVKLTLDDLTPKTREALRVRLTKEYDYLEGHYDNPLA